MFKEHEETQDRIAEEFSNGIRSAADVSCNCCYIFSLSFCALRRIYRDLKGLQ